VGHSPFFAPVCPLLCCGIVSNKDDIRAAVAPREIFNFMASSRRVSWTP